MLKQLWAASALLASACATAPAVQTASTQTTADVDPNAVQVMVVGSFHMGNPGRDLANAEIENMLTDQRQAEIAAVDEALAAFKPTVIAVERITEAPDYLDPKFQAFTPADLTQNADERYQLGYRLANLLGISRVYGVDEQPSDGEPDYFPFGKLMTHVEATGQSDALNAKIAEIQKMTAHFSELQKAMSVGELLLLANDNEGLANPDSYFEFPKFDRGEDQPGSELIAYWYMRNAKIFSKLMQVTKPGDRVVVVYGAGHKYWLEHFAKHTPGYVSVDPVPYLEKAAE